MYIYTYIHIHVHADNDASMLIQGISVFDLRNLVDPPERLQVFEANVPHVSLRED